ncbi:MAG: pyridoxal-dependent decarboxylase, partial [Bacteroidota bacterium]
SNIVCFRYIQGDLDDETLDMTNAKIRQELLEEGEFYMVQTKLKGKHFFRVTLMNPFTTREHLSVLLDRIKNKAIKLLK